MRVVKTDRGYIDMEHVLAVGEPYEYQHGLWGFDVTMAFLDKPKQMLYYPEDLGVRPKRPSDSWDDTWREEVEKALRQKRDFFVEMWAGIVPPENSPVEPS